MIITQTMTKEQIANAAVLITQILKENKDKSAIEVRQLIVAQLSDYLTSTEIIRCLTILFDEMGLEYLDVDHGIAQILEAGLGSISNIHYNSLWQEVAQGLYYVLTVVKFLVPPKWADVIRMVLTAYEELKNK